MRTGGAILPLFLFHSLFRRPAWQQIPLFQLNAAEVRAARQDIADLDRELKQPAPSPFYLRATFLRFLYLLARAFDRSSGLPSWKVPPDVAKLLQGLETILVERQLFQVDQIAERAGLSRRHAGRRFRAHLGMSLSAYYQRRRIHLACNLLLDPERTVTDVAYELGFSDGAHFTRSFHAEQKISPREYRNIYLEKGNR